MKMHSGCFWVPLSWMDSAKRWMFPLVPPLQDEAGQGRIIQSERAASGTHSASRSRCLSLHPASPDSSIQHSMWAGRDDGGEERAGGSIGERMKDGLEAPGVQRWSTARDWSRRLIYWRYLIASIEDHKGKSLRQDPDGMAVYFRTSRGSVRGFVNMLWYKKHTPSQPCPGSLRDPPGVVGAVENDQRMAWRLEEASHRQRGYQSESDALSVHAMIEIFPSGCSHTAALNYLATHALRLPGAG